MRWTFGKILLTALLVTQPIGILLLLVWLLPKWTRDDEDEAAENNFELDIRK